MENHREFITTRRESYIKELMAASATVVSVNAGPLPFERGIIKDSIDLDVMPK